MIGMLNDKDKSHWKNFIPTLVYAYNCTGNNATEFNPHYLMFRWKPRLALGLWFSLQTKKQVKKATTNLFLTWMRNLGGPTTWPKRSRIIKPGGISNGVTLRLRAQPWALVTWSWSINGHTKENINIANKWENEIYEVLVKMDSISIYGVKELPPLGTFKDDNLELRTRVLHQNMLFSLSWYYDSLTEGEMRNTESPELARAEADHVQSAQSLLYSLH